MHSCGVLRCFAENVGAEVSPADAGLRFEIEDALGGDLILRPSRNRRPVNASSCGELDALQVVLLKGCDEV